MRQVPNDAKLRELILYIAKKSEQDEAFGATKLNKILFYADFHAFSALGASITGQEYQKLRHGPAPRRLLPAQNALLDEGAIRTAIREYHGNTQRRCEAVREPNLSEFTSDELNVVDAIIAAFADHNAKRVSDLSHRFIGWKLAEIGETIPYEVALVGERRPTAPEIEWGMGLAERARECLAREA